jgi:hypothetical protein
MNIQIITLQCPKCRNTDNVPESEIGFGYSFKCKYCLASSLIIYDHKLYEPKPYERICIKCGRVASRNLRFCQCQAPLIQRCFRCWHEFPIHHEVCDECGSYKKSEYLKTRKISQIDSEIRVLKKEISGIIIQNSPNLPSRKIDLFLLFGGMMFFAFGAESASVADYLLLFLGGISFVIGVILMYVRGTSNKSTSSEVDKRKSRIVQLMQEKQNLNSRS